MTDLPEWEALLAEAQRELNSANAEAKIANERLSAAEGKTAALVQVVQGLRAWRDVSGEPQKEQLPVEDSGTVVAVALTPGSEEITPRGREAVRAVMTEVPKDWKQADLIAEIQHRGWVDPNSKQPDAAIRVAVRRLADDGVIEKVPGQLGVYRLKDSGATAPETATRAASESEAPMVTEGV